MKLKLDLVRWQQRLMRSGFLLAAVLFHLLLFLMVATWVVFKAPALDNGADTFYKVAIRPPPPPSPPPPSGGEADNHFEPAVQNAPPPAIPTTIATSAASLFNVNAVKVTIPSLPASITPPAGSEQSGHEAPGADIGAGNPFGTASATGAGLMQGYLYDLKQTPDHQSTQMDAGKYHNMIRKFIDGNWNPGLFRDYYKFPKPLNTSNIFIPTINAEDGPKAFGAENDIKPNMYIAWYKVTATPTQSGTYHFVGQADDILLVRVNGQTVLDACDRPVEDDLRAKQTTFDQTNFNPTWEGDAKAWVGLPFQATAGDPVDIEVIIGEEPGGKSNYFLYIQRDESTYQKQSNGSPLLPIFQLDTHPIHPTAEAMSYPPFSATIEAWQPVNKP